VVQAAAVSPAILVGQNEGRAGHRVQGSPAAGDPLNHGRLTRTQVACQAYQVPGLQLLPKAGAQPLGLIRAVTQEFEAAIIEDGHATAAIIRQPFQANKHFTLRSLRATMLGMPILVISDIHANLTALEAVLESCGPISAVWCLGDLVGYGPDPNECIERVRSLPDFLCLIGNHDQAALDLIPLARFNADAGEAALWTRDHLTEENQEFLRSLPSTITVDRFTLAHGSPRQPVWEYILDHRAAERNFEAFDSDYCLVGHSHLPLLFQQDPDGSVFPLALQWEQPMQLERRMILNPGSVGQPRDLDPRASFALLDLDHLTWEARRAAYDVSAVQERMLLAGLPERQALRLIAGW
jgi:diadenosine tetraphosphatase ApaH/serine/threonine PP2A family protein phosphatase